MLTDRVSENTLEDIRHQERNMIAANSNGSLDDQHLRKRKLSSSPGPNTSRKKPAFVENKAKRAEGPPPTPLWSPEMDSYLREGLLQHGLKWDRVREVVQERFLQKHSYMKLPVVGPENAEARVILQDMYNQLTSEECEKRWGVLRKFMTNSQIAKAFPPWTEHEKMLLVNTVKHALEVAEDSTFVKTVTVGEQRVRTVSWTNIAAALHRDIEDVNYQWNCHRLSTFKRGPFSVQEDRIIMQRYQEWSLMSEDQKPRSGLWVALEKELNREDKRISERWRSILSKRVGTGKEGSRGDTGMNPQISLPPPGLIQLGGQPLPISISMLPSMPVIPPGSLPPQVTLTHGLPLNAQMAATVPSHQLLSMSSTGPVAGMLLIESPDMRPENLGAAAALPVFDDAQPFDMARKYSFMSEDWANYSKPHSLPKSDTSPDQALSSMLEKAPSIRWNAEMDETLREGFRRFEGDWKQIAAFVNENMPSTVRPGTTVDENKCRGRWYRFIRHQRDDEDRSGPVNAAVDAVDLSPDLPLESDS